MSLDVDMERCPRCRGRDLEKVRAFDEWFTRCNGCGFADPGFDRALRDRMRRLRATLREDMPR